MSAPRRPTAWGTALLAFGVSILLPPAVRAQGTSSDSHSFDDPAQTDYTVINLPTTLRPPRHSFAFRLTHRFARGLSEGDFGDLASDLFGLDGGAQIGLELRFGLFDRTQLGVYRTSDRTIEIFAQQELWRHSGGPIGLAAVASVEGLDNFQEEYSPRLGAAVSWSIAGRAALYAVPSWVGNTRLADSEGDDWSVVLGLGARVLLGEHAAVVAEYSPRLAGFRGDRGGRESQAHLTAGLEGRVGGHVFQLNVSNDLGTTPAQVARGRQGKDEWFLGFNLSRKF
jgi:hypothetical protein